MKSCPTVSVFCLVLDLWPVSTDWILLQPDCATCVDCRQGLVSPSERLLLTLLPLSSGPGIPAAVGASRWAVARSRTSSPWSRRRPVQLRSAASWRVRRCRALTGTWWRSRHGVSLTPARVLHTKPSRCLSSRLLKILILICLIYDLFIAISVSRWLVKPVKCPTVRAVSKF